MRVRIAIVGVALCTYLATAARAVLGGDNGEFAALGAVGGVAHPPGYPLYVLWLRAFAWLPAASPAHRAALATAVLGALAVAAVYEACRAWGASEGASAATTAAFAFSPRAWIASTHAEVFALNVALGAAIIAVAGTDRLRGERRVAVLGALAGLGLSNHHTIVLLAPVGIYGALRGVAEVEKRGRAVVLAVGALVAGLTPYAYTLYAARNPEGRVVWGDASTFRGLLFHFRRGEYGTTTLTLRPTTWRPFAQLWFLAEHLLRDLLGVPVIAALGFLRVRRAPRRGFVLLASFVLAGPIFALLFHLDVVGLDAAIVERFHLLPLAPLAVMSARGLDHAVPMVTSRPAASALALGAVAALLSWFDVRNHHRDDVERWMRDSLAVAEPRAVLLGTGDHRLGAFLYAREALSLRRDVEYVDAMLLLNDWYRRRAEQRLGLALPPPVNKSLSTPAVASSILDAGRPLFLTNMLSPTLARALPTYPIGTLLRVLPDSSTQPTPRQLFVMNEQALAKFVVTGEPAEPGTWQSEVRQSYARPWQTLEPVLRMMGDHEAANRCHSRAVAFAP